MTAAGVSAPSIYAHFPDLESIVNAVITQAFAEFDAGQWAIRLPGSGSLPRR